MRKNASCLCTVAGSDSPTCSDHVLSGSRPRPEAGCGGAAPTGCAGCSSEAASGEPDVGHWNGDAECGLPASGGSTGGFLEWREILAMFTWTGTKESIACTASPSCGGVSGSAPATFRCDAWTARAASPWGCAGDWASKKESNPGHGHGAGCLLCQGMLPPSPLGSASRGMAGAECWLELECAASVAVLKVVGMVGVE